jgi:hypothetical protein
LEEERIDDFVETFQRVDGRPFLPQDDAGILKELDLLLTLLKPSSPIIFRSNHASNALPLAGTLPKDSARLRAEIQSAHRLRPRWMRSL